MSEQLFENPEEARDLLLDFTHEIVSMRDVDPDDFLGFCLCHDFRFGMAYEAIGGAIDSLSPTDLLQLELPARVIYAYLDGVDKILGMVMLHKEPADESTDDQWNMRVEALMAVGDLKMRMQEKWSFEANKVNDWPHEPLRLNYAYSH